MRYLKLLFFVIGAMLISASGTKEAKPSKGINKGYSAPKIQLEGQSLKNGKYTLLQFWAAYDPNSRKENVLMHNEIAQSGLENPEFISISFDENQSVFNETVRADKLNERTYYNDTLGEKSPIFKTYRLNKGFGNVLIDPEGVIIARNIQPKELKSFNF
jgi:hypothetical protein